jgi:aminoglycoside 3-N-acetyltransferase
MLTFEELTTEFQTLGVQPGDTLLVHSSYKSLGGVDGGPQTVVDALLATLTPAGTLIMPNFRKDPRAKRVFHPIYSFAIIGPQAEHLTAERYKSSYGKNSVFGKIRELDGKIMVIGLSYNDSMTFFHHIEEMEGVDYRYMKSFTGQVTDWDGTTREDTFSMLVRDIEKGVHTMVDPMGALMEKAGVITVRQIGEAKVGLMKANEVYAFTAREMRREPTLLYFIDEGK